MKVALVCNSSFGTDGISMFVMNNHRFYNRKDSTYHLIYSSIHSPQEVIDCYVQDWCRDGDDAQFISKKNGIHAYANELYSFFKHKRIDVLHIHGSSSAVLLEVVIAKIAKVNRIVTHAHSTGGNHPFIHRLLRPLINILADVKLACGDNAGHWMYGEHAKFVVIPNCIDTKLYCFNKTVRDEVRKEIGSDSEEIVIGHVGYFQEVKNQSFLLDIMKSLSINSEKKYKLLLIGLGPMKEMIEDECKKLGLSENVLFLGNRNDVCRLMMAMDVLCMPSLFEGFPIVAVEAQASGLPVFVSKNVSKEIGITDLVYFISINEGPGPWVNALEKLVISNEARNLYADKVKEAGYDIRHSAEMLENIYQKSYGYIDTEGSQYRTK